MVAYTVLTSLASVFVFGVVFLIGGISQAGHALKTSASKWSGFLLDLLVGVPYVVTGLLIAMYPLAGAERVEDGCS